MTRYVDFIRDWAQKHNKSYMCAATDPRAREEYYGLYPKRPTKKAKESAAAKPAAEPEHNSDIARAREALKNPAVGVLTNPDLLRVIGSYTNPNVIRGASKYGLSVKDAEDIKAYDADNSSQQENPNSYAIAKNQMRGAGYKEHWASIARGEKLMKKTKIGLVAIMKIITADDIAARKQWEKKRTADMARQKAVDDKKEAEGLAKRGGIKTKIIYYQKMKKNFSYDENNNVYDDNDDLFGKLINGSIIKNRAKKA